ncbi:hypothetical protein FOBRF1_012110 [Fusarium oxysporum]
MTSAASVETTPEGYFSARAPNPAEFPELPSASLSYWIRNYAIPFEEECAKTPVPEEVDLVIIGSGITGATAVYELSKLRPNLRVAMLEARGLCTGATGRNGGHMLRPDAFNAREFAEFFGLEESIKLKKAALRNRDLLLQAIEENNATEEVELRLNGTLTVFETQEERDTFIGDTEFCRQNGHEPEGYVLNHDEIPGIMEIDKDLAKYGAAFIKRSGTLYPRKLVAVLLRRALAKMPNLTIHPYTPVSAVKHDDSSAEYKYEAVSTKRTIRAKSVLHATNGYVTHLVPELRKKDGVYGRKAHMLGVTPNVADCKVQIESGFGYAEFWHWILQRPNNGPYLYGLATAEWKEDYNDTITLPPDHAVREGMLAFLEKAFPHSFDKIDASRDISYDWTGVWALTESTASIVGRAVPENHGEFVSVGHNGEGMGRCYFCSVVIVEAILAHLDGKEDWEPPEWFPKTFARNLGKLVGP